MKKNIKLILVIAIALFTLIGCSKSEEDIIRESRQEQGIEHLNEEEAVERLIEAKSAEISVFNGVNDVEEYTDEQGIVYNPFFEEYNSPEKVRTHIESYYYGDYAGEIIDMIPATYIDGVYVLPIGDIGRADKYENITVIEKKDIDEETMEISYKMDESSDYYFLVELIYSGDKWKIKDENMIFEEETEELQE